MFVSSRDRQPRSNAPYISGSKTLRLRVIRRLKHVKVSAMAKKATVRLQEDDAVSVEIDGRRYASLDQISSPKARARVRRSMQQFLSGKDAADWSLDGSPPSRPPMAIFWLFLSIAVAALLAAGFSAAWTARAVLREQSAQGVVVNFVRREDSGGWVYTYPVVEYSLPGYGRVTVQIPEGASSPAYTIGEPVTVLYDPGRPDVARIRSVGGMIERWTLAFIFGVLGLAFLAGAFFTRWILKTDEPA
jgi:hypothetical protein